MKLPLPPFPHRVLFYIALCMVLCFGCAEATDSPDNSQRDASTETENDSLSTSDDTAEREASIESTFAGLQAKLFEGQGCSVSACHGSSAEGGLDLSAGTSYEQLVDTASTGSSLARVEPGDRSRSYLYLKLLAAMDPEAAEIAGSPMPVGAEPIPADLLEALRLWIYAGAPEDGVVIGTEELLGVDLPPPKPLTIAPLPVPAPDEGFQIEMPGWVIPSGAEREVCFASYFDIRDQIPESMKDETGDYAFVGTEELRQDPQSHHLILNLFRGGVEDIHHKAFGDWQCRGGDSDGEVCEPTDLSSCPAGHCATEPTDGFGCIGYGPQLSGSIYDNFPRPIGGAQKSQDFQSLPEGVYKLVPLHGILFWNSHAFNVTTEDHRMNGRLNFYFAEKHDHRMHQLGGFQSIFLPNTPPFQKEELCSTVTLPRGARVFTLSSHTHKRGERFTIFHPDDSLLYENLIYNDPLRKKFDPPLIFDAEDDAERRLRYCAVYNNGVDADGQPDPETVTRYSRLPDSVHIPGVPGMCSPEACASGLIGAPCDGPNDHAACDSTEGAGDGLCDACSITGGESTENEMFLMLGDFYLTDPGE